MLVNAAVTPPASSIEVTICTSPTGVWKIRVPAPSRSASATAVAIVAWPQNGTSLIGEK